MYSENLKKIRDKFKLSVEKLAEKTGIPASTLWGYEGKKRMPSIELPIQLYRKLNISANWFLMGEGEMLNKKTKEDFLGKDFTEEEATQMAQRLNSIELRLKNLEENKKD